MITAHQLRAMARGKPDAANMNSLLAALEAFGRPMGLDRPHRLAHFLAQLLHESGSLRHDREVWGPTPQQRKYDTGRLARQLGNTPAPDGDGRRYRGRTAGMITGRANYAAFTAWARRLDAGAPDFVKEPEKANTDPWEGLGPLWYWDAGNPEGRSLNRYADDNNIEMITRRINGGMNGFADRVDAYVRAALVLLGYSTGREALRRFQREHPQAGEADGVAGARTRMALHGALAGRNPFREEVPVDRPVVPRSVDDEVRKKTGLWEKLTGLFGFGAGGGAWLLGMQWQTIAVIAAAAVLVLVLVVLLRRQIIGAVRDIRAAVEEG